MSSVQKIEELLATGNVAQFTPQEKVTYINKICEMTGLNPLTRPFEFVNFQGKTVLYARKDCTDQLRKIHGVSIKVTNQQVLDGLLTITVEATDKTGRTDSDMGALNIAGLKGDALANATMKALTKAKRRVTLSICGLGILDESELETIQGAHVDQSAYLAAPPTSEDYAQIESLLESKGKTIEGLLKYLNTQFSGANLSGLTDLNSAQIQYARRMLGGV
jgi:hypothetical protein